MADKSSASQDYITFLSRGPEKGLSLDVTDLMITTEPAAANILDVRKTVWLKLILVFIHRHDLRVLSKKKKNLIYKTTQFFGQVILFPNLIQQN